jgi:hypothetical protein
VALEFQVCTEGYEETKKECTDWRDDGYETCGEWGQECTSWAKKCVVKWIPFIGPAICKVFEWVCKGFEWVCKGFVWVSQWVCHAWNVITTFVCLVWETVQVPLVLVGLIVKPIFSIPIIGGLIKGLWNSITAIGIQLLGFIFEGIFCGLLGICLPKKMRLCLVIFKLRGEPLTTEAELQPFIDRTKQIYKDEADVNVHIEVSVGKSVPEKALDPPCGSEAWLQDWATLMGMWYEQAAIAHCTLSSGASVVGLGGPLYAFAVQDVTGGKSGCSLGPWSNYIVFEAKGTCETTIAHEIGHACSLWHQDDPENLMHGSCTPNRGKLAGWQKVMVRASKYVTYH